MTPEDILRKAEVADGFFNLCKRSNVNTLARRMCSYTAWNDQSLAQEAKEILHPEDRWVSIVILNPSAEGGMPHTRPGVICLPAYYPESKMKETLRHEMVHISQKLQPTLWLTRLAMDGWKPVAETAVPEIWRSRCRLNPDTASSRFFAWKGRYIPLPLYIREDKPDLREIQVRWYDITDEIVRTSPPTSFLATYGNLGQNSIEHPYELYAYKS